MHVDCLVVGYGLAGATLVRELLEKGLTVALIDDGSKASSQVAAGIVNPVIFRHLTPSWMADVLLPFSRDYYQQLSNLLQVKIFYDTPVLRIHAEGEQAHWGQKQREPRLEHWLGSPIGQSIQGINMPYGASKIDAAFWVDIALMISKMEAFTQHQLVTLRETFDYRQLQLSTLGVRYKTIHAEKIIFCEGYRAVENPLFHFIPFRPVKGEVMIMAIPGLGIDYILNKDVFVLPLGEGVFKVGATYDWSDLAETVTTKAKETLLDKLGKFLELPYVVLSQEAGIRPSIADRRPVAGIHPLHKNVFIFNGLGAKGAMLAPFFAQELSRFITEGIEMNPAVDPIRFDRFLKP